MDPQGRSDAANRAPVRTAVLIFLFLNFTYLLTSTGRVHTIDEISAVMQAESITLRRSTAIPQAVGSGVYYGKLDVNGQPHSPYPPGHPLAVAPWYWVGGKTVAPVARVPRESLDLVLSMATTWSSATFAAAAVAFGFLLAFSMGAGPRGAMIVAAMLAFASPLFVYSAWLFSEPLTAALWMAAALALFGRSPEAPITATRAAVAGALLGFSLHVRPTNAIAATIFLIAMLVRGRKRDLRPVMITAVLVALAGIVYLARNASLYGNLADFGYPATAEGGRELNTFHTPLLVGLTGFLISPGKSVLLFFPVLPLAIAALGRLWQRDRGMAVVCGATPAVYIVFYSTYTQWEGIYCWGPRYIVPALVLLGVAVSEWLADPPPWFGRVFGILFVTSLLVQLIGLSTNVLEDMVRNHYYYSNWQYRWSYSALVGQLMLIGKYLGGAPAPLGYGFDRWFLFLRKAGASAGAVWALALPMLVGWATTAWMLAKEWKRAPEAAAIPEGRNSV
jgi:hypothetical protein